MMRCTIPVRPQGRFVSLFVDGVLCSVARIAENATMQADNSFGGCAKEILKAIVSNNGVFKMQAAITRPGSTINPSVGWGFDIPWYAAVVMG
jgi:hypothetical protein